MVKTQFSPTGQKLKEDELKFGYWFITHKVLLRQIGILILGIIDLFLVLFSIYGFVDYYLLSRNQVLAMHNELTAPQLDYQYISEIGDPLNLTNSMTAVIKSSDNHFDFVAQVQNQNSTWYVKEITFHFESGNFVSPTQTDYILPLQTKYLMTLGQKSDINLAGANLIIENISWEKTANFELLQEKIVDFQVRDAEYLTPSQSQVTDQLDASRVKFTAINASAYNFWEVKMKVLLYRGTSLVYINEIPYRTFASGEIKNSEFIIYERIGNSNRIEIYPEVDILNPSSFKGFDGEGQAK